MGKRNGHHKSTPKVEHRAKRAVKKHAAAAAA